MKKLNGDIRKIDTENEYQELRYEFDRSEKLYTFLLNYSEITKQKIIELNEIISKIISSYEQEEMVFDGNLEAFDAYKQKLLELYDLTLEAIENQSSCQ